MATIEFENGVIVDFDGDPTPQDVEEVANSLGINKPVPKAAKRNIGQKAAGLFLDSVTKLGTEFGQGVGAAIRQSQINKALKKGDLPRAKQLQAGLERGLNTNAGAVPFIGTPTITPKDLRGRDIAGQLLETAAIFAPGAAKGVSLAKKTAIGAATGYGFDVASNLQGDKTIGQSLKPGLGTLIGGALPGVAKGIGSLARNVAGFTSGVGSDVVKRAVDNPEQVGRAVKEFAKSPQAKQELVETAKSSIQGYLEQRGIDYGRSINQLTSKVGFQGKKAVVESFAKNLQKFNGKVSNGQLTFVDSTLTKADQNNLRQAYSIISKWKGTSVKGLDDLRQAIGNLMDDFKATGNSRASVVLGNVKDDLTKSLSKSVPGYGEALKAYGVKSNTAKQLLKELSLSGQAKESTQLNQIMRLFKKDPEVVKKLEAVMGKKGANDFLNEISGAILSDWAPKGVFQNIGRVVTDLGLATAGILSGSAMLGGAAVLGATGSSPRIVGKVARLLGKAKNAGINKAVGKTGSLIGSKEFNP